MHRGYVLSIPTERPIGFWGRSENGIAFLSNQGVVYEWTPDATHALLEVNDALMQQLERQNPVVLPYKPQGQSKAARSVSPFSLPDPGMSAGSAQVETIRAADGRTLVVKGKCGLPVAHALRSLVRGADPQVCFVRAKQGCNPTKLIEFLQATPHPLPTQAIQANHFLLFPGLVLPHRDGTTVRFEGFVSHWDADLSSFDTTYCFLRQDNRCTLLLMQQAGAPATVENPLSELNASFDATGTTIQRKRAKQQRPRTKNPLGVREWPHPFKRKVGRRDMFQRVRGWARLASAQGGKKSLGLAQKPAYSPVPKSPKQHLFGAFEDLFMSVNHEKEQKKRIEMLLESNPHLINGANEEGDTLLHLAVKHNHANLVQYLLSRPGVQLNARDKYGFTPLLWATHMDPGSEVVRLLQTALVQQRLQYATVSSSEDEDAVDL